MNMDQYIKVEQTKALYQALPAIIVGTLGISIITVSVLWAAFDHQHLLFWLAASVLIMVLRWYTCRTFDPSIVDQDSYGYWLRLGTFWSFITGLSWSLIPIFFFKADAPTYVLFITCLYAGYTSASMASNSSYFPAFLVFMGPTALFFSIRCFYEGGAIYTPIGFMVLFYAAALAYFARKSHLFFMQARELNYHNMMLMQEVVAQKEAAENAVQAKNQFLASASHDLRQPLHAQSLFIDALQPQLENQQSLSIVEKIRQSMNGLNDMLHSLLDISRLDANAVINNPQHHSLNNTIEQLCAEYSATVSAVRIVNSLQHDYIILADPTLVGRILRNLLDNAVKYTPDGEIVFSASATETDVHIVLRDTGIGIPEDKIERVFDEFQQLNNPERNRRKGLGLGLAIVKRLCSLTNIKLSITSVESEGTSAALRVRKGDAKFITSSESKNKSTNVSSLTIVVIDDEQDILEGMQQLLESWKCNVISASSCDQAITKLSAANVKPDVLIVDFRLKANQNGLEAIELIRQDFNDYIPAILVTGDTAPHRIIEAQTSGVPILYKPVESAELQRQIQAVLQSTI